MNINHILSSVLVSLLVLSACRKDKKDYTISAELLSPYSNGNGTASATVYWHGRNLDEWHTTVDGYGAIETTTIDHPNLPMKLLFAKENMQILESGSPEVVPYFLTNEDFIQIYSDAFLESIEPVNLYLDYQVIGTFTNTASAPSELTTDEKDLIDVYGGGDIEQLRFILEYKLPQQNSPNITTVNKEYTFVRAVSTAYLPFSTTLNKFY
ncbi:MAG: hypothetical protein ACPGEC_03130 [Flavobacteriales bacterium]